LHQAKTLERTGASCAANTLRRVSDPSL